MMPAISRPARDGFMLILEMSPPVYKSSGPRLMIDLVLVLSSEASHMRNAARAIGSRRLKMTCGKTCIHVVGH